MKTNDISIAFISFPGGGKWRPILTISDQNGITRFYKITSKYQQKLQSIRQYYFRINQWREAGLYKESYVDTITIGKINRYKFNLRRIGHLTKQDADRLEIFLENQL